MIYHLVGDIVSGEVTTKTYVDIPAVVRNTVAGIGYTRAKFGFDHETSAPFYLYQVIFFA